MNDKVELLPNEYEIVRENLLSQERFLIQLQEKNEKKYLAACVVYDIVKQIKGYSLREVITGLTNQASLNESLKMLQNYRLGDSASIELITSLIIMINGLIIVNDDKIELRNSHDISMNEVLRVLDYNVDDCLNIEIAVFYNMNYYYIPIDNLINRSFSGNVPNVVKEALTSGPRISADEIMNEMYVLKKGGLNYAI